MGTPEMQLPEAEFRKGNGEDDGDQEGEWLKCNNEKCGAEWYGYAIGAKCPTCKKGTLQRY